MARVPRWMAALQGEYRVARVARERTRAKPRSTSPSGVAGCVSAPSATGGTSSRASTSWTSKIDLLAGEESRQRAKLLVRATRGQERVVLRARERTDSEPRPRLLVPDLVAGHRADAELRRRRRLVAERALRRFVDRVPPADELLDLAPARRSSPRAAARAPPPAASASRAAQRRTEALAGWQPESRRETGRAQPDQVEQVVVQRVVAAGRASCAVARACAPTPDRTAR